MALRWLWSWGEGNFHNTGFQAVAALPQLEGRRGLADPTPRFLLPFLPDLPVTRYADFFSHRCAVFG